MTDGVKLQIRNRCRTAAGDDDEDDDEDASGRRSRNQESEPNVMRAVLHTIDYCCVQNPDASGAFHTGIDIDRG